MNIKIENFGPIAKGKINIKPLTIFIGPNNTGKSYAAILISCVYSAFNKFWRFPYYRGGFSDLMRRKQQRNIIESEGNELKSWANKVADNLKKNNKFESEIPKDIIAGAYRGMIYMFTDTLSEEISRAFASNLKDLKLSKTDSFSFAIKFNGFRIQIKYADDKLIISNLKEILEEVKKEKISLNIIVVDEPHHEMLSYQYESGEIKITLGRQFIDEMPNDFLVRRIYEAVDIAAINITQHLKQIMNRCYYLPAARSGIIQGHKAISASLVSEAPLAGLRKIEIPTLSGITADFIISLIQLEPIRRRRKKEAGMEKVTDIIEKDIMKGKISVQHIKHLYPEFTYNTNGLSLPLHRTSSMVSELAPVVLYLRYLVDKDDVLIIEEPEAHLHPGMQRKIARVISLLIRNGVNVLITTHSDYLVGQISNLIRMSILNENERKELGYSKEEFLNPDDVSTYLFKSKVHGTDVEEIKVSEEGISQEEFVGVVESLYGEEVKIERKLMRHSKSEYV